MADDYRLKHIPNFLTHLKCPSNFSNSFAIKILWSNSPVSVPVETVIVLFFGLIGQIRKISELQRSRR